MVKRLLFILIIFQMALSVCFSNKPYQLILQLDTLCVSNKYITENRALSVKFLPFFDDLDYKLPTGEIISGDRTVIFLTSKDFLENPNGIKLPILEIMEQKLDDGAIINNGDLIGQLGVMLGNNYNSIKLFKVYAPFELATEKEFTKESQQKPVNFNQHEKFKFAEMQCSIETDHSLPQLRIIDCICM